ncbi:MAG: hypothetical protein GY711_27525 [bacterium]|nr:hypothetical protein [bacterium]
MFATCLPFGASAGAQMMDGDLLVNLDSMLAHHRPDGTLVSETVADSDRWGAFITPDDRWVTRGATPPSIQIYDANGSLIQSFLTPEVASVFGDCAVFADGTIAVSSFPNGKIEVYDGSGVHQRTIDVAGGGTPFGLHIDPSDTMWVAGRNSWHIWRYRQDGTLLNDFDTASRRIADLDTAPDGTLWGLDWGTGFVHNYAPDGTELGAFQTMPGASSGGLAVGADGTLWVCSLFSSSVWHFEPDGTFLGSFPIPVLSHFIAVKKKREHGDRFCPAVPNSTGRTAVLTATGSTLIADNDLTLTAIQLPPGEFGYFIVSSTTGQVTPPGSTGVLCIGCSQGCGRYSRVSEIIQRPSGSLTLDLTGLPLALPTAVQPGDTWNFQCWFRDVPVTSNHSDALAILFS